MGQSAMTDLIHHFEKHLVRMSGGWSKNAEGQKLLFQVVQFESGPIPGIGVIAMLGLSDIPLRLSDTGKTIRQELVMLYRMASGYRNYPGIIQQVAMEAINKGKGYLAREVLGPRGPLFENSALEALYV